jgi:hypothetical protein
MSTNILKALINISNNPIYKIQEVYKNKNRANSLGDALEEYIKDSLSDTFNLSSKNQVNEEYSKLFSYIGNTNNPPDLIIKGGDAFEIKKTESFSSSIALNSSFPKNMLYSTDTRITNSCKNCEDDLGGWDKKDIIYTIGNIENNSLKNLWFIYGTCYCADKNIYEKISNTIKNGIHNIHDTEFTSTNELAKINKVDPLGITYLRVRGMWGIDNPISTFSYLYSPNIKNAFNLIDIIPLNKYNTFPIHDRQQIEKSKFNVQDKKIKDPNNPASLIDVKLITYEYK